MNYSVDWDGPGERDHEPPEAEVLRAEIADLRCQLTAREINLHTATLGLRTAEENVSRLQSRNEELVKALERCRDRADKRKHDAVQDLSDAVSGNARDRTLGYYSGVVDTASAIKCEIHDEIARTALEDKT